MPVNKMTYICLSAMEIHKEIGHISQKSLIHLHKLDMILGIELASTDNKISCNACIKSKTRGKPLPKELREQVAKIGDRLYSDIWGPLRHPMINKKCDYISFIDDYL